MLWKKKRKPIEYDKDKADMIAHAVDSQFMKNPDDEEAHDKNFMMVAKIAKLEERIRELENGLRLR